MSDTFEPAAAVLTAESGVAAEHQDGRLSKRLVFAIALSQFANTIPAVALVLVSLPITVAALDPANKANTLALVMGLYATVGILGYPIAGVLSDRCTSRFGMRRPFILIGALASLAAAAVLAFATSVPVLIGGAMALSASAAIYAGGNAALVPDQVPERHRGRVMGLIMMMTAFAGVVAAVLIPRFIGNQVLVFMVPSGILAVAAIVVVAIIRDRRLQPDELGGRQSIGGFFAQFKINPAKIPDYSWAWLGRAIVTLGTVLTTTYGVYFLTDKLHVGPSELGGIITITGLIGLTTAIGGALLGSWLSDKLKMRKKMVLWTSSLIAIGAVIAAFAPSVPVYIVALFVMGLGSGAYFPIDGALIVDVLPGGGHESGKYMSLMQLSDSLPRSLGPFLAAGALALGAMTPVGGYSVVFIAGGVIAIVGGLLVRKVKGSM